MYSKEGLVMILKEEFGITTREQLEEAFRSIAPVDISIFTSELPQKEKNSGKNCGNGGKSSKKGKNGIHPRRVGSDPMLNQEEDGVKSAG